MLDIRLLGPPSVTVDGRDVEVDTRKAIAVLAYLAVEGSADRDALATMFWGDSAPDRARATLRRTLSALRAGVGPDSIDADRNRVRLLDGHICDVSEFQAAIGQTHDHGHLPGDVCERCIEPLTRAAALYRGDFLGAFSVREAPDFEDWARNVGESLRLQAGEALRRLAHAQAATGDYSAAIASATRWIALDDLHEPAHRLLMLLSAWAGDRAGAIRAYRDCVAILDRELGVAPLEETTELFEAILDEDLPPAPGMRRPVRAQPSPAPPPAETELIDRVAAIEIMEKAIAGSRTAPGMIVLTGDSWMGKTRLLEHTLGRARAAGHQVASSTAFRAESHLPYGVAIQILETLVGLVDGGDELAPWALEELARLLPRLTPGAIPPDTGQLGELRLRDAFLSLVELVTAKGPLVLVVDDAQWADSASASLIAHIMRRAEDLPLLIVIAARDTDTLHPAWREWVADGDAHLVLGPLQAADLTADLPMEEVQEIIEETGGIPLLVKEALEAGAVSADSSSVARYIESRRARLTELASQVMTAAAVLDGMCDASLLRDTSGRTEEEVVEAVEELLSSGLLREQEDQRLRFTLDVVERVTYESTSLIRRRLLHKRAANAMQARARSRTDARMATAIAGHLREAGEDEAAEWYRLAGDLARGVFANSEAVEAYETAIALGHPDVGAIRLALGELAMTSGDYEAATRELQTAASQSEGPALALVEHRIGDLHRVLGRFDLAEESFARAAEDHPRRSGLYADWALLRDRVGDTTGAIDLAYRALGVAETESETARARNVLGLVIEDQREARTHIDRALAASAAMSPDRMAALNNKAHLLAGAGDHEAAIGLVEEAIDIAVRAGYRHQHAALLNHLADLNHRAGRREDAEKALTEAVTIFAEIDSGDWRPEVWLLRHW